jgi:hypothetical protein
MFAAVRISPTFALRAKAPVPYLGNLFFGWLTGARRSTGPNHSAVPIVLDENDLLEEFVKVSNERRT